MQAYTYFKQEWTNYSFKKKEYSTLRVVAVMIGLPLSTYLWARDEFQTYRYINLAYIAIAIYHLQIFAQQISINMTTRTITKSYLGLFPRIIEIDSIKRTEIVQMYTNWIPTGNKYIVYYDDTSELTLFEISKRKTIEQIAEEFKMIIKNGQ